jgi:hypothetical protein
MTRGNHEICRRAGEGWFRFLEAPKPGAACAHVSASFVADLGGIGFLVMDSAAVAAKEGDDEDDEGDAGPEVLASGELRDALRRNYEAVAAHIPRSAWLVTHAPFNGVRVDKDTGDNRSDNTLLQETLGPMLPSGVEMIVSGHIHLFEALNFSDGRPPQLVVGTGGDKLGKRPKHLEETEGLPVRKPAIALKQFGFMVWDRDASAENAWTGNLFDENGRSSVKCVLQDRKLSCAENDQ